MIGPRRLAVICAIAGAALIGYVLPALALCPGCIEGSSAKVQAGFQWSILFMMAVPYFAVGVIGGGLYLAYRKSVRRDVESFLATQEADSVPATRRGIESDR